MEAFYLDVLSNNIGGYFSSEQLDLLSIIECQTYEEIIVFLKQCEQLKGLFKEEDFPKCFTQDIEQLKRYIFKTYQDTLVLHDSDINTILDNTLSHLDITQEDKEVIKKAYPNKEYIREYIKNKYPNNYVEIFKYVHRFISLERDQNKDPNLYDELLILNDNLKDFNTLLVGSGKPEVVINDFFKDGNFKFDFYFAKRDLDFAFKNNKHIRLHSLLTKGANESFFEGKTKEEILNILTDYVKAMINFINEYNATHKLQDGTPVINAVDLFNEIISFDKNKEGEYENIWESKYGITIKDICEVFKYALDHKPNGVSFLYNEPFLEDFERRKKVIDTLKTINDEANGLIDTLGSQMHITFHTSDDQIRDSFEDFKSLQDNEGINIQITEFDLSLSERETLKTIGENPQVTHEQVYNIKKERMANISKIINASSVKLNGVSYWSLTDNIDCNLQRVRTNLLKKRLISSINEVSTVCGGLIPTYYPRLDEVYKKH